MSLGWWESKIETRLPLKLYKLLFGVPDLHSHIRFRAIKKFFPRTNHNAEIGAGSGIMSIGFYLSTKKPITALAYTKREFKLVKSIVEKLDLAGCIKIGFDDAQILGSLKDNEMELLLCIDVLEHVDDDKKMLREVNRVLRLGGYLVVSCPTPNYPKYFGERFDLEMGHQRHYTYAKLEKLLKETGFGIIDYFYYTRLFNSLLCQLWYKRIQNHYLKFFLMPFLKILSHFETESKAKGIASSLCVLSSKVDTIDDRKMARSTKAVNK